MKARHLYYIPAILFLAAGIFSLSYNDNLYWLGLYGFMSVVSVLAALKKLNYTVIITGFALLLFLITSNFPPIELWGLHTREGREIISLIVSCNWMGLIGVIKLYNDSYK